MGARFPFNSAFNAIQLALPIEEELIVDLFAGGGGASLGIEMALGRRVNIAINHNPVAVSLHARNHPDAIHLCENLRALHPREVTRGRKVALLHASPDCRDHSQSKGGQPRSKEIRGLSWQIQKWAGTVSPTVITMENVKQIQAWCPLIAKRDKATGRVIKLDGSVAEPSERVPIQQQFLVPDPKRAGRTWSHFRRGLEGLGYKVEVNMLNAANFDTPTTRNRLFLIARRDGVPISWPMPTHAKVPQKGQKCWRTAGECIDWSVESKSIFGRKRPLADATLKRIATGIKRYVLDAEDPYFVPAELTGGTPVAPVMTECANASSPRCMSASEPARTICATTKGGHLALIAPTLVQAGHGDGKPGRATRWGKGAKSIKDPAGVVTASGGGGQALTSAFLVQANGGFNATPAKPLTEPSTTITASGSQQQLVTATLVTLRNNCDAEDPRQPLAVVTANGQHHGVAEHVLTPEYHLTPEQDRAIA
jgi:DNA (cytosine-5)-methyltransferase 1